MGTLLPNPPPMSGEMIRILCSGSPVQRVQGAVRVRCLAGSPDGELPGDRVEVGHRAAGLQRGRVRPRVQHVLGDDHVSGGEHRVSRRPVARRPVEDVVIPLARHVVPDHRRPRVQGLPGVDDHRQRLVLHVDQLERVAGGVPVLGDDERHLLALEPDLVGGQHGLHVPGQGGHPGQLAPGQHLAGDDGPDPGMRLGGRGVHRDDPGVRQRAAQDGAVQHARQRDVVDEGALAAQEPGILLAPQAAVSGAHDASRPLAGEAGRGEAVSPPSRRSAGGSGGSPPRASTASCSLAHRTDRTMFS